MNEAERYLEEKLNPTVHKTAKPVQPPPISSDSGMSSQTQSASAQPRSTKTSAGTYVLAVLACLGIVGAYVALAATLNWKRMGGYVVMVIFVMLTAGVWKAITRK